MANLIAPFDPEAEIRSIKEFPSSINTQNMAILLSVFFCGLQRGLATEEQYLRYARGFIERYSLSPDFVLFLIERIRGFDFNQNPALMVDEIDRCIWIGRFSLLRIHSLLSASEAKRVTSWPWWDKLESSLLEWYLSADDEEDGEDEDL